MCECADRTRDTLMGSAAGPFRRKPPWTELNRVEAEALLEFGEKVSCPPEKLNMLCLILVQDKLCIGMRPK